MYGLLKCVTTGLIKKYCHISYFNLELLADMYGMLGILSWAIVLDINNNKNHNNYHNNNGALHKKLTSMF